MENETQQSQDTQEPVTNGAEANQQTAKDNDLNLADLSAMKSIIELASARGAFKPNEMTAVGKTYDKLNSFLTAVSKGANNGS